MLTIIIPGLELFDERTNEFITLKEEKLQLEHSLVSVSKWESKWCKPFLSKTPKTVEETIDYIACMTLTKKIPREVYNRLTDDIIRTISEYIDAPMSATKITQDNKGGSREIITSEVIYYWMIALNIPFECQKWHLNRLLTLVNVCNIKSNPPKKMSAKETMQRNRSLNEARKKALTTSG